MTSTHPYGPHRPEDAPNAVTVLGSGMWPAPEVRPIPSALVRQRARVNELARMRGAGEGYVHLCRAKGHEVWTPTAYCVLCRSVVVTDD